MNKKKNGVQLQELSWEIESREKPILDSVSTNFDTPCFYGILGPNGSGKTSLIRHILRFLSVDKDVIYLNGEELNSIPRKELAKNISFVPQDTSIDVTFNVYEMVAMGRAPHQKKFAPPSKEDREKIEEALRITEIEHLKESVFSNLSGGEKQRVLIARAIAQDTPFIILDEPISNLDIKHQVNVMEMLKKRNIESGCTIISILHDLNLAANYCDKIVLMKDGRIFVQGETEKVLTKENLCSVYGIEFHIINDKENNRQYYMPIFG